MNASGDIDLSIEGLSNYREIGRSGFSVVYSARQAAFDHRVAVEVLYHDEEGLRRIHHDQLVLKSIAAHPNIAVPFASGRTRQGYRAYLLMEHLSGGSLRRRLTESGPIGIGAAVGLVLPIAAALDHCHRAKIVHKDVSPRTVLLSATGAPKLTRFGMVDATCTAHTAEMQPVPNPFAAPELLRCGSDRSQLGELTDLYSLGATLYALTTGSAPFGDAAGTPAEALALYRRIESQPVPTLGHQPLDAFLARAMAKEPNDRYRTAAEFGSALRAAVPP